MGTRQLRTYTSLWAMMPHDASGTVLGYDAIAETVAAAYETGRGSFRVRGRFHAAEADKAEDREAGIERLGGGQWQLVISEIP